MEPLVKAAVDTRERLGRWVAAHEEGLTTLLVGIVALTNNAGKPDNWFDLPFGAVSRLWLVSREDQICLVWVPLSRAEIVREVVAQSDRDARCAVLVDHRRQVLNDCAKQVGTAARTYPACAGAAELALRRSQLLAQGMTRRRKRSPVPLSGQRFRTYSDTRRSPPRAAT